MGPLILRTTTRYLLLILLLFSLFLLMSGHNEPGGGFTGGLMAAAAICLYTIGFGAEAARKMLRIDPPILIGVGLMLAASSGLLSLALGQPFMTSTWRSVNVPALGKVALGTPLLFDTGVYLVVVGATVLIVLSLAEEWNAG
ncbi:MAG: Na+/H+ antiporter subunit B [Planctomycetota bacterium]|jgi:multicomponent Na+:H+ antiporter subunit B